MPLMKRDSTSVLFIPSLSFFLRTTGRLEFQATVWPVKSALITRAAALLLPALLPRKQPRNRRRSQINAQASFVVRREGDFETTVCAVTDSIPVTPLISLIAKGKTKYSHCPLRLKTYFTLHPTWRRSFDALTSVGLTALSLCRWSQQNLVCGATFDIQRWCGMRGKTEIKLSGSRTKKPSL